MAKPERDKGILVGMNEITAYSKLSEPIISYLIENAGFPAKKTKGDRGTWISNGELIDTWSKLFVQSTIDA